MEVLGNGIEKEELLNILLEDKLNRYEYEKDTLNNKRGLGKDRGLNTRKNLKILISKIDLKIEFKKKLYEIEEIQGKIKEIQDYIKKRGIIKWQGTILRL